MVDDSEKTPYGAWLAKAQLGRRSMLRAGLAAGLGLTVGGNLLAACSNSPLSTGSPAGSPPAKPTGTLRVPLDTEPTTLDPALNTGIEFAFLSSIYESLMRFKGDTPEVEGHLAESVESSPDAREWVFRLKDGVKFHDGEPLTSSAVKASFEHYAATPGLFTSWVHADAEYDDSDPRVLRIMSKKSFPDMARNAASMHIISPKLVAKGKAAINKNPTGTGPFTFVRYVTAKGIVLQANPDYRGPGPYLERVEIPIIPDPSARAAALRSGDVDLLRRMTSSDSAPLRDTGGFTVVDKLVGETSHLWLNTKAAPTNNVKIRQAISYAIDRQAIVDAILGGTGAGILDSVVPPGTYGYKPTEHYEKPDLDRARRLVEESGLQTPIQMEAAWVAEVGRGRSHDRVLSAIGGMLKEIDIDLKVVSVPVADAVKANAAGYKRGWQAIIFDIVNGLNAVPLGFSTKLYDHYTGLVDNEEFQRLQTKMMTTPDGPERQQAFARMQEYFAEQQPTIQLYNKATIDAYSAAVHGYEPPRDGNQPDYRQVYLSA